AFNANLVLGVILVGFVLLLPKGVVPTLKTALLGLGRKAKRRPAAAAAARTQIAGAE
ncbi:branched-chain amino acid ABC transporter permease, partial [Methylobacterium frigidaeris]